MSLAEAVKAAGVVGAGGAGFPTHVKVSSRVDTLIANGAECEPVLATDQWVMARHAGEIAEALREVGRAVGARRVVLAVKHKYREVIRRFRPFLEKGLSGNSPRRPGQQKPGSWTGPAEGRSVRPTHPPPIELFELGDFYPSGDEQVLVHEVTSRVVPEGGLPLDVGVVVQNVSTLLNVHRAMAGSPVILKHVTVAGEVRRPGVYVVPVGTSAAEVIAAAGGATIPEFRVVDGGPMMGFLLSDTDRPVTKTTSGYLVLPPDHPAVQRRVPTVQAEHRLAMAVCCGCRMCTDLCPRYLLGHRIEPHKAMRAVQSRTEDSIHVLAMGHLCCLCGVCEAYACPMGLSPRRVFESFKVRLGAEKVPNPYRARPAEAREAHAWSRVPKARLTDRLQLARYVLPPVGEPLPVPEPWEVRIPLRQHIGAPARPVVRSGDRVAAGDCIAEVPDGALGARVHASISGLVRRVDDKSVHIVRG